MSVDLAAPPLQHVDAPGTFFVAPALTRPAKAPAYRVTIRPAIPEAPAQTLEPQGTPQAPVAQPPAAEAAAAPSPVAAVPAPAPAPPPAQAPVPAPVQTPEPPRVLAVAQPPAEPQTSKKHKGHGHAWGHVEHDDTAPAAPDAPTPEGPVAPTDVPVVSVSPDDSSGDEQGNGSDEQGEQGKDNGNGHGHGSEHEQGSDQKHSGD